ncbi:hypothetical protein JCM9957A_63830 [Kineosporia succinea]
MDGAPGSGSWMPSGGGTARERLAPADARVPGTIPGDADEAGARKSYGQVTRWWHGAGTVTVARLRGTPPKS